MATIVYTGPRPQQDARASLRSGDDTQLMRERVIRTFRDATVFAESLAYLDYQDWNSFLQAVSVIQESSSYPRSTQQVIKDIEDTFFYHLFVNKGQSGDRFLVEVVKVSMNGAKWKVYPFSTFFHEQRLLRDPVANASKLKMVEKRKEALSRTPLPLSPEHEKMRQLLIDIFSTNPSGDSFLRTKEIDPSFIQSNQLRLEFLDHLSACAFFNIMEAFRLGLSDVVISNLIDLAVAVKDPCTSCGGYTEEIRKLGPTFHSSSQREAIEFALGVGGGRFQLAFRRDEYINLILCEAAGLGNLEMTKEIIQKFQIEEYNVFGWAYLAAIRNGHKAVCDYLITGTNNIKMDTIRHLDNECRMLMEREEAAERGEIMKLFQSRKGS